MAQYDWETCPGPVRAQVQALCEQIRAALDDTLVGIYLHGSLALGCFNPEYSDLDLLVVNTQRMPVETKRYIMDQLLHFSTAPSSLEISFLVLPDIGPFRHPLPFDLHYSEAWRQKSSEELANGSWRRWNEVVKHDPDLAAHVTIVRQRGITLFGKPATEVFPPVPDRDYISAIASDYHEVRAVYERKPVYFVLNACRVHAYLTRRHIFSKDEGGAYGLESLPPKFHPLIQQALEVYRGQRSDGSFGKDDLAHFAMFMDQQIL